MELFVICYIFSLLFECDISLIAAPYDSYRKESQFNAFWVRESNDGKSIGLPLQMKFTTQQDQELTQHIINEMVKKLVIFNDLLELFIFALPNMTITTQE